MTNDTKVKSIIDSINPLVKIIALVTVSLLVSFDRNYIFSIIMFLLLTVVQFLDKGFSYSLNFIIRLRYVFFVAISYIFFILLSKKLSNDPYEIDYLIAIAFRFVIFGSYSLAFIDTVAPKELIYTLIKYCRFSEKMGFAFLAAYRFLPTFKEELEKIKFTHVTRGITRKGIFAGLINFKNYLIPLLVTAIRKGIRLSISMESRAFGKFENRTYFNNIYMNKIDYLVLVTFVILLITSIAVLIKYNLLKFSFIY